MQSCRFFSTIRRACNVSAFKIASFVDRTNEFFLESPSLALSPDTSLRWFFKFRAVSFLLLLSWHFEWLFNWPTPVLLILKDLKQIPQKADWRSVLTEVTQGWSFPQAFSYLRVPGISWSIWIIIIIHLETEWRNLLNNLQLTWEFKQVKTTEDTQKDINILWRLWLW